jgi:hypothetical protein
MDTLTMFKDEVVKCGDESMTNEERRAAYAYFLRGRHLARVEAVATLRDQFAMAALTGYMAYPNDCRSYKPSTEGTVEDFRQKCALEDAEYCYLMADAMLEARRSK